MKPASFQVILTAVILATSMSLCQARPYTGRYPFDEPTFFQSKLKPTKVGTAASRRTPANPTVADSIADSPTSTAGGTTAGGAAPTTAESITASDANPTAAVTTAGGAKSTADSTTAAVPTVGGKTVQPPSTIEHEGLTKEHLNAQIAIELNSIKESVERLESHLLARQKGLVIIDEHTTLATSDEKVKTDVEEITSTPSATTSQTISTTTASVEVIEGKEETDRDSDKNLVMAMKKSLAILQGALISHQQLKENESKVKENEEEKHVLVKKVEHEKSETNKKVVPTKAIEAKGKEEGKTLQHQKEGKEAFHELLETVNKAISMLNNAVFPHQSRYPAYGKDITDEENVIDDVAGTK